MVDKGSLEPRWYLSRGGKQHGPYSGPEILRLAELGKLLTSDLVWKPGFESWKPVHSISGLLKPPANGETPPPLPASSSSTNFSSNEGYNPHAAFASVTASWVDIHRAETTYRHAGSTAALILGGLALLAGLGNPNLETLRASIVIILGALAYRSAKKRKLGEVKSTSARQFVEISLLLLICLFVLMQKNLTDVLYTEPLWSVFVPLWSIVAYLFIALRPSRNTAVPRPSSDAASAAKPDPIQPQSRRRARFNRHFPDDR